MSNHKPKGQVRFKCTHNGKLHVIFVPAPPRFQDLRTNVQNALKQDDVNMYFVDEFNREMKIASEKEFSQLLKEGSSSYKLQLRLSDDEDTRMRAFSSPARPSSPPPGFLEDRNNIHGLSNSLGKAYPTVRSIIDVDGGGEFIPERMDLMEGHLTVRSTTSSVSGHSIMSSDSMYSHFREDPEMVPALDDHQPFGTVPRIQPQASRRTKSFSGAPNTFPRMKEMNALDHQMMDFRIGSGSDVMRSKIPKRWQRGRLLGSGGFGKVYLGHDQETGREFAVKIIDLLPSADDSKELQSLEEEISLLRNLQHERIVTYFGTDHDTSSLYIFMEYVPGRSIHQRLKEYGKFSMEIVKKYTRQILEGLDYLHCHRIIHRDIKGANILVVSSSGNIKLADFGSSKRLKSLKTVTGVQSFTGTFHWMAPEVVLGQGCGRRSDIWSLGCTIIEMLTTRPPFSDLEHVAIVFKIGSEEVDFKTTIPADVTPECKQFLSLCFIRDKDKRPTAHDLLDNAFVATI